MRKRFFENRGGGVDSSMPKPALPGDQRQIGNYQRLFHSIVSDRRTFLLQTATLFAPTICHCRIAAWRAGYHLRFLVHLMW